MIAIVSLVILSNSNDKFSIEKTFIDNLKLKDNYMSDGTISNYQAPIKIGEIKIANDYFLAKRIDLQPLIGCFVSKKGTSSAVYAGNIFYSEGDYSPDQRDLGVLYDYSYNQERSVQVSSKTTKSIKIYLDQPYSFYSNYSDLINTRGYDDLLLLESKLSGDYYNSRYTSCYNLTPSELEQAKHISLSIS